MTMCSLLEEEKKSYEKRVDLLKLPHHIAIIMDGNRRWAKKNNESTTLGHQKGADSLTNIVKFAAKIGIKALTVYSFSTENWYRSLKEVHSLFCLFHDYLKQKKQMMIEEGVRLNVIGDTDKFPLKLRKAIDETVEGTKSSTKLDLILALNYGSRDEICRAIKKICNDIERQVISKNDVTESLIAQYLDTKKWKDPDLLIRTSGQMRLSNFLLWQLSYSEVIVQDTLWPDFTEDHLIEAISEYQQRKRRIGR